MYPVVSHERRHEQVSGESDEKIFPKKFTADCSESLTEW
jgi:hypothetical protein